MNLSLSFRRLKSTFLIFFMMTSFALGADQTLVNLGRWNSAELARIISTAGQLETPGEQIVFLSGHFIETPYVANTLVGGPQAPEKLVVNLAGFDCFTLLDVVEALRRAANGDDFPVQLRQVRYRDGRVNYEARRHFFSDWVADRDAMVSDVTAAVGQGRAQVVNKRLNQKSDGSPWLEGIPVVQREVSYIPAGQIDGKVLSALRAGDYVGVFSDLAGLDVSHTGLLVKSGNDFMLRHASSRKGVRQVVDDDLLEYLQGTPGLVVYRVGGR